MGIIDQDRFFSGKADSSTPRGLLVEGDIARLINARFMEGCITNGPAFEEIPVTYYSGPTTRVYASKVTYQQLLEGGDVQLDAPLKTLYGEYKVLVISGILFLIDLSNGLAYDITPQQAYLPETSQFPISYIDNDGGVEGVGSYLVINNYPNKTIFVNQDGARLAEDTNFEMPPSRMGVTAANRAFVVTGTNLFAASDPLGGFSSLAPLTFRETYSPTGDYRGQIFTAGTSLDIEEIMAMERLPKFGAANAPFGAQSLIVFTRKRRYLISASSPRSNWDQMNFVTYAGSSEGPGGPLATTVAGNNIIYSSISGRIKTISQDQYKENSLVESYFDEPLGQYFCLNETRFNYRRWYEMLDHSRAILKYNRDVLYATVMPIRAPALGKFGQRYRSPSYAALAIATIDSQMYIGQSSPLAWECFVDWLYPIGLTVLGDKTYITSKDSYGRIKYYVENHEKLDSHTSTIYTRGYFFKNPGTAKSVNRGYLVFEKLSGDIKVKMFYQDGSKWIDAMDCNIPKNTKSFQFKVKTPKKVPTGAISLRIDIEHNGCEFLLKEINLNGESFLENN